MRRPWARTEPRPVHANEPHPFRRVHDAGLGTGLTGMGPPDSDRPSQMAMTSRYLQSMGCGVPGCGKGPDDPIHEPDE